VWTENHRRQRVERREVHAPLFSIFKRALLGNTLTACWWMASGFVTYYSINALFATHLQKDLGLSPGLVATPIASPISPFSRQADGGVGFPIVSAAAGQ
jgi:SHS family lactate transporter-like MFS transporter